MMQPDMFECVKGDRDGPTYVAKRDRDRLDSQAVRVFRLMSDGQWRTLERICMATGIRKEQSASARLRDFRKPKFGAHTVEDRNCGGGIWEYRLLINKGEAA